MTSPRRPPTLDLDAEVVASLRQGLAGVAESTVAAVTGEVPEYAAVRTEVGETILRAVQLALATFLRLAERRVDADAADAMQPAVEGAYALGRGEARSGRTMDALLTAYRVGAREAWREWSATAVAGGVPADTVARFAELVFAFIDELSAASVAGHTDELARSGRVREQYLERLGAALLAAAPEAELVQRAELADWPPPQTLTAVLVATSRVRGTVPLLDARTLVVQADATGDADVLLVPDADRTRAALLRTLRGRAAVVGPSRPWAEVAVSYRRAARLAERLGRADEDAVDTEAHLAELVLTADAEALADLRAQVLRPLDELAPATAERLAETLRSWLLHQGRREDVARDLLVHPQTVRYRMTQVRDLFGDRLSDPDSVFALTVALGVRGRNVEV